MCVCVFVAVKITSDEPRLNCASAIYAVNANGKNNRSNSLLADVFITKWLMKMTYLRQSLLLLKALVDLIIVW